MRNQQIRISTDAAIDRDCEVISTSTERVLGRSAVCLMCLMLSDYEDALPAPSCRVWRKMSSKKQHQPEHNSKKRTSKESQQGKERDLLLDFVAFLVVGAQRLELLGDLLVLGLLLNICACCVCDFACMCGIACVV